MKNNRKRTFLTLMLGATILMGVEPAQAGILASTRAALRLLVSPVTANDQIFINNMKTNYGLLKNFEAESGEESADYYPLVSVLLEIKALAKEVVDLSATLSSPMNDGYDEALKTLHEKYDRAEKLWEQMEKLNNESPLAYFMDFIQNFGVKTAWAAGYVAPPEVVDRALERIEKIREEECVKGGGVFENGFCCGKTDTGCQCTKHAGGVVANDGYCCTKKDGSSYTDCFCDHGWDSPRCKCAHLSNADYVKCNCEEIEPKGDYIDGKCCPKGTTKVDSKGNCCKPDDNIAGGECCPIERVTYAWEKCCPEGTLAIARECCKEDDEKCKCKATYDHWIVGTKKSLCCLTQYRTWTQEELDAHIAKCHCDADGWNWNYSYNKCCPVGYHWIPWSGDPS